MQVGWFCYNFNEVTSLRPLRGLPRRMLRHRRLRRWEPVYAGRVQPRQVPAFSEELRRRRSLHRRSCNPIDGSCYHTPSTYCDDGNPCTADECDPETGECTHPCDECADCPNGLCVECECETTTCDVGISVSPTTVCWGSRVELTIARIHVMVSCPQDHRRAHTQSRCQ